MAVPMDWSVVEPMVGILVSSMPAIRSVIYFFDPKYGHGSQNSSALKSNLERGHVQLHDFSPHAKNYDTTVSTKRMAGDDDSEKNLIYQGARIGVTTTTDIEISPARTPGE
jgi:hypothetical protein